MTIEERRLLRAANRANGLCGCGKRTEPDQAMCSRCTANASRPRPERNAMTADQRSKRARNRAAGLCGCGRPVIEMRKLCSGCNPAAKEVIERPMRVRDVRSTLTTAEYKTSRPWLGCCENFTHYPTCRGGQ